MVDCRKRSFYVIRFFSIFSHHDKISMHSTNVVKNIRLLQLLCLNDIWLLPYNLLHFWLSYGMYIQLLAAFEIQKYEVIISCICVTEISWRKEWGHGKRHTNQFAVGEAIIHFSRKNSWMIEFIFQVRQHFSYFIHRTVYFVLSDLHA